jgi:hypothetical protein
VQSDGFFYVSELSVLELLCVSASKECTHVTKILDPPQTFRRQNVDVKQG